MKFLQNINEYLQSKSHMICEYNQRLIRLDEYTQSVSRICEYNVEKLYQYNNDIDKNAFDVITNTPKKTIYINWLLNLYRNKKLKLEDMQKADMYIKIFNNPNVYNKLGGINIINNLKSIQELFKLIKPYYKIENVDKEHKNNFIYEKCFVKEFKNYNLYIPKTFKESQFLGKNTQWCTAQNGEDSKQTFYEYNSNGELYIFISKENPKYKLQLHTYTAQFTDLDDESMFMSCSYLIEFIQDNEDIINYIKDISLQMYMYIMVSTMNMKIIDSTYVAKYNFILYNLSNQFGVDFDYENIILDKLEDIDSIEHHLSEIQENAIDYESLIVKYNGKYITSFSKCVEYENPDGLTVYNIDDFYHPNEGTLLIDEIIKVLEN